MIVLNILGYFCRKKQNSYANLTLCELLICFQHLMMEYITGTEEEGAEKDQETASIM